MSIRVSTIPVETQRLKLDGLGVRQGRSAASLSRTSPENDDLLQRLEGSDTQCLGCLVPETI